MTEPKVSRIYSEKPVSAEVNQAANDLDQAVSAAIEATFSVCQRSIARIVTGKGWNHV